MTNGTSDSSANALITSQSLPIVADMIKTETVCMIQKSINYLAQDSLSEVLTKEFKIQYENLRNNATDLQVPLMKTYKASILISWCWRLDWSLLDYKVKQVCSFKALKDALRLFLFVNSLSFIYHFN